MKTLISLHPLLARWMKFFVAVQESLAVFFDLLNPNRSLERKGTSLQFDLYIESYYEKPQILSNICKIGKNWQDARDKYDLWNRRIVGLTTYNLSFCGECNNDMFERLESSLLSLSRLIDYYCCDDKNKAETHLQDFSLLCYFSCWNKTSNMSKSTCFTGQQ